MKFKDSEKNNAREFLLSPDKNATYLDKPTNSLLITKLSMDPSKRFYKLEFKDSHSSTGLIVNLGLYDSQQNVIYEPHSICDELFDQDVLGASFKVIKKNLIKDTNEKLILLIQKEFNEFLNVKLDDENLETNKSAWTTIIDNGLMTLNDFFANEVTFRYLIGDSLPYELSTDKIINYLKEPNSTVNNLFDGIISNKALIKSITKKVQQASRQFNLIEQLQNNERQKTSVCKAREITNAIADIASRQSNHDIEVVLHINDDEYVQTMPAWLLYESLRMGKEIFPQSSKQTPVDSFFKSNGKEKENALDYISEVYAYGKLFYKKDSNLAKQKNKSTVREER